MGEMVSFASNGDSCEGYLATPKSGHGPGVIVVQEWWGLVDHIRDVADRFAAEGFVALAPDFFHGASTDEPDEAQRLLMGLAMDRAARTSRAPRSTSPAATTSRATASAPSGSAWAARSPSGAAPWPTR